MSEKKSAIRLSRLTIKNYKKIDYLEIDFPKPLMKDDADILVFGSKNGGGKTSVLECCALLMLAGICINADGNTSSLSMPKVVKAGEKEATLIGEIESDQRKLVISLTFYDSGIGFFYNKEGENFLYSRPYDVFLDYLQDFYSATEPLIQPRLIHFNSYRRIQTANPSLNNLEWSPDRKQVSVFKQEVVGALVGKTGIIENVNSEDCLITLSRLNSIAEQYCAGLFDKVEQFLDGSVGIRVKPKDDKVSFSYDGLSSGQKEMIATLFLIWKNTQDQPSIVLIDEPELHLNAEWHSDFVQQLHKLAPQNQYILATHSKEIFRSVDKGYRAILESDEKGIE